MRWLILAALLLNLAAVSVLIWREENRAEMVVLRSDSFEAISGMALQSAYRMGLDQCRGPMERIRR